MSKEDQPEAVSDPFMDALNDVVDVLPGGGGAAPDGVLGALHEGGGSTPADSDSRPANKNNKNVVRYRKRSFEEDLALAKKNEATTLERFLPYTDESDDKYNANIDSWYGAAAHPYLESVVERAGLELKIAERDGSGVDAAKNKLRAKQRDLADSVEEYKKLKSGDFIWTDAGLTPTPTEEEVGDTGFVSESNFRTTDTPHVQDTGTPYEAAEQELAPAAAAPTSNPPMVRSDAPFSAKEADTFIAKIMAPYGRAELEESEPIERSYMERDLRAFTMRADPTSNYFASTAPISDHERYRYKQTVPEPVGPDETLLMAPLGLLPKRERALDPYFKTHRDERHSGTRFSETEFALSTLSPEQKLAVYSKLQNSMIESEDYLKTTFNRYNAALNAWKTYEAERVGATGDSYAEAAMADAGTLKQRADDTYNQFYTAEADANSKRQAFDDVARALTEQSSRDKIDWNQVTEGPVVQGRESFGIQRIGELPGLSLALGKIDIPKSHMAFRELESPNADTSNPAYDDVKGSIGNILPEDKPQALAYYQRLSELRGQEEVKASQLSGAIKRIQAKRKGRSIEYPIRTRMVSGSSIPWMRRRNEGDGEIGANYGKLSFDEEALFRQKYVAEANAARIGFLQRVVKDVINERDGITPR